MYFNKAYLCVLATFQFKIFIVKLEFNLQYQFQTTLLFQQLIPTPQIVAPIHTYFQIKFMMYSNCFNSLMCLANTWDELE